MESLRGSTVSPSAVSASCRFSSLKQIFSNQQFPVSRGTQLHVPGSLLVFFCLKALPHKKQKQKPKKQGKTSHTWRTASFRRSPWACPVSVSLLSQLPSTMSPLWKVRPKPEEIKRGRGGKENGLTLSSKKWCSRILMQEKRSYSKSFKTDLVCILLYFLVDITSLLKNAWFKKTSSEIKNALWNYWLLQRGLYF